MKYAKAIYIFAKKYKLLFFIAEICILTIYAISLILPFNLIKLIDEVIYAGKYELLNGVIKSYVILLLIFVLTNMLYAYVWQKLYNEFVVEIKCSVYEKVIKSKSEILSNINSGDIMTRIDWDCDQYINAVQRNLFHFVNSIILCLGTVFVIARINKYIAVIAILAALLPIVFTRICGKYNEMYSRENREVNGRFTGRVFEIMTGFREIKINGGELWATNQIKSFINKLIKLGNKTRRIDFIVNKGIYLLNLFASVIMYILSVYFISNNVMTVGNLLAIISYVALLHKKFNWILRIYLDWKGRKISVERVTEILSYENENCIEKNISEIKSIAFSKVKFDYGQNNILNNVEFCINNGDKVAIVGISGIGKSTIINLILKLYEAKGGDIVINNINIKELNATSIREKCSVVSQDIMLFDDTIRENLLAGMDRTDSEIFEALKKVELYEKITKLPKGLDTEISGGFDLSGGQKQRLMIARAILKNADTFILDEATSALDVKTEKNILNNLFNNQNDRTILLISHRPATVSVCDKVIVIDEGTVEYAGDIKSAISKSAKFKELFGNLV